jgi:hypothetical protein
MTPEEISKLINKRIFFNNLGFLFGAIVSYTYVKVGLYNNLSSYHVKDNNNQ